MTLTKSQALCARKGMSIELRLSGPEVSRRSIIILMDSLLANINALLGLNLHEYCELQQLQSSQSVLSRARDAVLAW